MASFSERQGYRAQRASIGQFESMDDRLRNALWNFLDAHYWAPAWYGVGGYYHSWAISLMRRIWDEVLGLRADTAGGSWGASHQTLRGLFYDMPWNEVYDLVEFIVRANPTDEAEEALESVLQREGASYRWVGGSITPITSSEEIAEIGAALNLPDKFAGCSTHLQTALNLLADREKPDYRNSVKESISAVEAAVRVITGKPKATLGEGLKAVGADTLHPALNQAWDKMYGWTSDGGGIRHALGVDTDPDLPVARYMPVACSAFVNYLIARS